LRQFSGGQGSGADHPEELLSDRELEIFRWIGQGMGTRQIADILCLSIKTVETYRDHIKTKLNLKSSYELVYHAIQYRNKIQH
ncbi:MAG TPA: helix-turn-helix transcriptional regulator, partial [Acidobacteriota bacterium]